MYINIFLKDVIIGTTNVIDKMKIILVFQLYKKKHIYIDVYINKYHYIILFICKILFYYLLYIYIYNKLYITYNNGNLYNKSFL